jgi:hypothetical protein
MSSVKICISGRMGAGVSYAATYFETAHGAVRWSRTELMKRLAHAVVDQVGDLEDILVRLFADPAERSAVRDDLLAYQPPLESGKPRQLYQEITEICQSYEPLCFDIELEHRIEDAQRRFLLIDDIRSRDAFEFFTNLGYTSVRIEAPEALRQARITRRDGYLPSSAVLTHSSETELDYLQHDFTVFNLGSNAQAFAHELDIIVTQLQPEDDRQ